MDAYGLELQGRFIVERVTTKPGFNDKQIGRFIFVESDDTYWVGGLDKWLSFGLTSGSVKYEHVNWGKNHNQIHSGNIPYLESVYRYIDADNIEDALIELAKGDGLNENSVNERILADECVHNYHVKWGTEGDAIGAKDLSINSLFRGSEGVSNIGTAVNRIEQNCPIIIRKTVQPSAWEIVPAEGLYRIMITTVPINSPYVIVQCYDLTGKFLIPAKITTDLNNSRVYVYMPQKQSLAVVIVG